MQADYDRPDLIELSRLDDAAFRQFFAGTPVKRSGRDNFIRNVLIALGNMAQPEAAHIEAVDRRGSMMFPMWCAPARFGPWHKWILQQAKHWRKKCATMTARLVQQEVAALAGA